MSHSDQNAPGTLRDISTDIIDQMKHIESLTATSILSATQIPVRKVGELGETYHRRVQTVIIEALLRRMNNTYQEATPDEHAVLQNHMVVQLAAGNHPDERAFDNDPKKWRAALMYLQRVKRTLSSFKQGFKDIYDGIRASESWLPASTDAWRNLSEQVFHEDADFTNVDSVRAAFPSMAGMFTNNPPETILAEYTNTIHCIESYENARIWTTIERFWVKRTSQDVNNLHHAGIITDPRAAQVAQVGRAAPFKFGRVQTGRVEERYTHCWVNGVYGSHGIDVTAEAPTFAQLTLPDQPRPIPDGAVFDTHAPPPPAPPPRAAMGARGLHTYYSPAPAPAPAFNMPRAQDGAFFSQDTAATNDGAPDHRPTTAPTQATRPATATWPPVATTATATKPAATQAPAPAPAARAPQHHRGDGRANPRPSATAPTPAPRRAPDTTPATATATGRNATPAPPPEATAPPPGPTVPPGMPPPHFPPPGMAVPPGMPPPPFPPPPPTLDAATIMAMIQQQAGAQAQTLQADFERKLEDERAQTKAREAQMQAESKRRHEDLDAELQASRVEVQVLKSNPNNAPPRQFAGVMPIVADPHGHTPPLGELIHVYKTRSYLYKTPESIRAWQFSLTELKATFYNSINRIEHRFPDITPSSTGQHLIHLSTWLDQVYEITSTFGIELYCFTNGYPAPPTLEDRCSYRSVMTMVAQKIKFALACPSSRPVVPALNAIVMPTSDTDPFTPEYNIVYRYLVCIKAHVLTECSQSDLIKIEERAETMIRQEWRFWESYVETIRPLAQITIEFGRRPDLQHTVETMIRFLCEDDRLDCGESETREQKSHVKIRDRIAAHLDAYKQDPVNNTLTWEDLNGIVAKLIGYTRYMRPGASMVPSNEAFPGSGSTMSYEGLPPGAVPTAFHAAPHSAQAHPSYMMVRDVSAPNAPGVRMPYTDNKPPKRSRSASRDRSQGRNKEDRQRGRPNPHDRYGSHERRRGRDDRGRDGHDSHPGSRTDRRGQEDRRSRSRSHDHRDNRDRNDRNREGRDRNRDRSRSRSRGRDDGKCFQCGETGHQAHECPNASSKRRGGPGAPPLPDPTPPGAQANLAGAISSAPPIPQNFEDGRW